MRRRILSAVLAALMGGSLAITPASSQDAPFTIDPTVGLPGDTVTGQVDPTLVTGEGGACIDDVDEMQANDIPPLSADLATQTATLTPGTNEHTAATVLGLIFSPLGIGGNDEQAAQFLANTYILTFADIATMEPVGDNATFDPVTGEGTITVPDLAPGLWAVAASCVFPDASDPAAFTEAITAGTEHLLGQFDDPLNAGTIVLAMLGDPTIAEGFLRVVLPSLMVPQEGAQWTASFTIPAELPTPDPALAAFCAALPQLPGLGEELMAILAAFPVDDGSMSQANWEAAADWEAIGAELEALVGEIEALLAEGDTSRPDGLADEWATATAPLRQVRDALQAVDFDLSTESGRMIAGQLRAAATSDAADPAGDSATAVLTEWFANHCIPAEPAPAAPAAPAARAANAQPRYTG